MFKELSDKYSPRKLMYVSRKRINAYRAAVFARINAEAYPDTARVPESDLDRSFGVSAEPQTVYIEKRSPLRTVIPLAAAAAAIVAAVPVGVKYFGKTDAVPITPSGAGEIYSGTETAQSDANGIYSESEAAQNGPHTAEDLGLSYSSVNIDTIGYKTYAELINASDHILLGKITDISFEAADMTTGKAPEKGVSAVNYTLLTVYEMTVDADSAVYKSPSGGTDTNDGGKRTFKFAVYGGIKNRYLDEQALALAKYSDCIAHDEEYEWRLENGIDVTKTIPIIENAPEIKLGEEYVVALTDTNGSYPVPTSIFQGILEYGTPQAEGIISFFADNGDTVDLQDTAEEHTEPDSPVVPSIGELFSMTFEEAREALNGFDVDDVFKAWGRPDTVFKEADETQNGYIWYYNETKHIIALCDPESNAVVGLRLYDVRRRQG